MVIDLGVAGDLAVLKERPCKQFDMEQSTKLKGKVSP